MQANSRHGLGPRILLVDDVELNRILTEAVLKGATFDVDTVQDGVSALHALDRQTYDLILMDLDMPGLDGHAAAAAIHRRAMRAPGDRTPQVVALSARNGAEARNRSRDAGMADHIPRPIGPGDLIREVQRLLAPRLAAGARRPTWVRQPFEDLVQRLGRERMRHALAGLLTQCGLARALLDPAGSPDGEITRTAHDLVSVGGMLGFAELADACFDIQSHHDGPIPAPALARVALALERSIDVLRIHLADPHLADSNVGAAAAA